MPRKSRRPKLQLDQNQRQELVKISQSRTAPLREVQRAKILLNYADGKIISAIKKELNVSRPSIYKCIDKALAAGIETGLKDKYHSPKVPVITTEAKAWVINLVPVPSPKTTVMLPRSGHYHIWRNTPGIMPRLLGMIV